MYTIMFSRLYDGEMFSNSYTYNYFRSAMNCVDDIMRDYVLIPNKDGDYWTITVFYDSHTVLTLNSAMF